MKIFMIWLFMVGLFFFIHLLVWRYKKQFQSKKNLIILSGLVFLSIVLFNLSFLQFIHLTLAYFSVCFSYLIFYLWLEGDSPTLRFIQVLDKNPGTAVSMETLKSHFVEKNPITGRLDILVEEGFCVHIPPHYRLTRKGIWLARLCTVVSRVLNIELEG
jgi:hypothetical protein